MIKRILYTFFSLFLIYQSFKIVMLITDVNLDSWPISLLLACLINLFVTGAFAFPGFVYPTERLMPQSYYKISNDALQKKMYKLFSVDTFQKFLLATVWRKKEMQKQHFDGKRSGFENLILQSKKSEFGHLIPFVILLAISMYWLGIGTWKVAVLTTFINVLFNLYPVLLQRQHRMRVSKIAERYRLKPLQ